MAIASALMGITILDWRNGVKPGFPRSVIPRATEPGITGSRPSQRHMRRNAPDSDYLQMPPRAIGGDVATGRLARGRQKAA